MNAYTDTALLKGEIKEYLIGYPNYSLPVPALLPQNPEVVFDELKGMITEDPQFRIKFLEAFARLAIDPEYCWMALYYLFELHYFEKKHPAITLISEELIEKIRSGLRENSRALKSNKNWEGKNWENGIWGDVQRLNRTLHHKYNLTILPEELELTPPAQP